MRSALLLPIAFLLLPGCAILGAGSDDPDCAPKTTAKAPLDPFKSITTHEYDGAGTREYFFNLAPTTPACVGQHAPWKVVADIEAATSVDCSAVPGSMVVQASANGFGINVPATETKTAQGGQRLTAENNIGTGQFSTPAYLSILAKIKLPGGSDAGRDANCAEERIKQLVMTIDYQPSKSAGGSST